MEKKLPAQFSPNTFSPPSITLSPFPFQTLLLHIFIPQRGAFKKPECGNPKAPCEHKPHLCPFSQCCTCSYCIHLRLVLPKPSSSGGHKTHAPSCTAGAGPSYKIKKQRRNPVLGSTVTSYITSDNCFSLERLG